MFEVPQVPVSSAIQEFSLVQLSPHSRRAYQKDLEDFFGFLRTREIWAEWNREITPLLVAQYREHLVVDRQLAKSSVTRKLAVVKSFCKWALARGWIEKNPADLVRSFPQTQESKTGYLSSPELHKLLGSLAPMEGSRLFRALMRVTVETLVMLGLRRSEAASIHMKDLEILEGAWTLRVHGKGERSRVLPLPERLLDTWSQWLRRLHPEDAPAASLRENPAAWSVFLKQHSGDPLLVSTRAKSFDAPLSPSEIGRIVRQASRRAGLVQRVTPHALRATAITHALDEGASHRGVQQMAGWTSPLMITRYDKRRKDHRFSAIHHLSYAKNLPDEAAPVLETSEETQ
jgi:site-specific recombinase XerD